MFRDKYIVKKMSLYIRETRVPNVMPINPNLNTASTEIEILIIGSTNIPNCVCLKCPAAFTIVLYTNPMHLNAPQLTIKKANPGRI